MKIKLSEYKLLIRGLANQVLWEIVDWEGPSPTSDTLLIYPKTQIHGYIFPSVVIRVQTPKLKTVCVGMSKNMILGDFREERFAIVQTPEGLEVARAIYICDHLDLLEEIKSVPVETPRKCRICSEINCDCAGYTG